MPLVKGMSSTYPPQFEAVLLQVRGEVRIFTAIPRVPDIEPTKLCLDTLPRLGRRRERQRPEQVIIICRHQLSSSRIRPGSVRIQVRLADP